MKKMIVFLIFCYILFLFNTSMVRCSGVCEMGNYEGANFTNKNDIEEKAPRMEAKLYDELGLIRVRNFFMFNFGQHLSALKMREKRLDTCKCVYKAVMGNFDSQPYPSTDNDDDAIEDADHQYTITKRDPKNKNKELNRDTGRAAVIDCYINNRSFTLIEGYRPRLCIGCYDIYILVYESLNKENSPKWVNREIRTGNSFKIIGKVNKLNIKKLLY